jgi:hypothetical protein
MRWLLVVVALAGVGCSGSSAAPSPTPTPIPTPTPTPTTITISGTVRATNGGHPLAGVQAALGTTTAATDAAGQFSVQTLPTGTLSLALTGSGIVPRSLTVGAGSSRSVTLDAIALGGGFDLTFYRQFVRNGSESQTLQPLRRWTRHPQVFIQTGAIDVATLDMVEAVIRDAVPRWTANRFTVTTVERGAGTREGQAGWLTVKWATAEDRHCGNSQVGFEGGWVELRTTVGCGCNGWTARPSIVRHELGHALGYWHTDQAADVMHASDLTCDKPITARELYHAAIAYARPVGNVDPDTDPVGAVSLAPLRVR